MCGLTGLLGRPGPEPELSASVRRMAGELRHRGPDAEGVCVDAEAGLALGHRRLAILELSEAGAQPMVSADGRYVIAFNGEIYNHLALRRHLEEAGAAPRWRGHSDTETLLAAIAQWGLEAALRQAVGMFALALWDRHERVLSLARDRMGEKPLYYGRVGGCLAFASELKALRRAPGFDNAIDRDALALFVQFNYVPAPRSIYAGISKLPAGTVLRVGADRTGQGELPEPETWWSAAETARAGIADPITDEAEALSALEAALGDAVAGQMLADVPLGAFLSGGVDSSAIVALMQARSARPVATFTVGFDEAGYDESPHAAAVARHLGTEHHETRVSAADARNVIPHLPSLYDEPFADSSQIPTFLVAQAARRKVTVALSGDGGDELFGGYNRYFWGRRIWDRVGWLPFPLRRAMGRGLQAVPPGVWDAAGGTLLRQVVRPGDKAHKLGARLQTVRGGDDLYRSLVTEWRQESDIVQRCGRPTAALDDDTAIDGIGGMEQRMMLWDQLTYLPDDILCKVDRAAMAVSLETRVPFLDHRVVELAWRLPLHLKIRAGAGKWALRQILYRHVPRELIERPKAGFAIPVGPWLRGPLRDWAEGLLAEPRLGAEGFFNPAPIRQRWMEHLSGRHDWTASLWSVLMFQSWLEQQRTP